MPIANRGDQSLLIRYLVTGINPLDTQANLVWSVSKLEEFCYIDVGNIF